MLHTFLHPGLLHILFVLTTVCVAKNIPVFAGPYITYVERITPCDKGSTDGRWAIFMRASRFNRYNPTEKQKITGNLTLLQTFDDTAWAHMRMDIRANNEWKNGAFVLKFPKIGCSMFRANVPSLFKAVYKGVSMTGACSAPPGVYVFDDPVDWAFPNIHVFPYGHYYLTLNTGQRDSKNASLCSHVELRFIPKSVV